MIRVSPGQAWRLFGIARSRELERMAAIDLPVNTLMQRAGSATAKLALAISPHARHIWIACGPGNNGGDGMEAAVQLARRGKVASVTWIGNPDHSPPDSAIAHQRALQEGIEFVAEPPGHCDLFVDALLGIGAVVRQPDARLIGLIGHLNSAKVPVLSVDIPSGLQADTGFATDLCVKASHTLSLLTLKPGLFMGFGRDACGEIWFDDLAVPRDNIPQTATLLPVPANHLRSHRSHKGTFGDVAVVGGAKGMTGAALLAASAALHRGAGRVYVCLVDATARQDDVALPELMFRDFQTLDISATAVVCGCGGGELISEMMPALINNAQALVVDADGINALANDPELLVLLRHRASLGSRTVLTPHPLEAARLLKCSAADVQADRIAAAEKLSQLTECVVVLKGSGTVIAQNSTIALNLTGNGRLATAGTGDVLAGMVGAGLAAGLDGYEAACQAVYIHGHAADQWPAHHPLTASVLARLEPGFPAG